MRWFGRNRPKAPSAQATTHATWPLFEHVGLPMLLLDRQGRILASYAAFTRECGFNAAVLGRTSLRDLLSHRQDAGSLADLWNKARTQGQWQGSTWLHSRHHGIGCRPPVSRLSTSRKNLLTLHS